MATHATKFVYLYRLPQVLVLHLKRFQYTGSIVKNHKHVAFDAVLKLKRPILGDDCPDAVKGTAEYSLIATVSHHGKHAAGARCARRDIRYDINAFVSSCAGMLQACM